jgi:hypothetical protein
VCVCCGHAREWPAGNRRGLTYTVGLEMLACPRGCASRGRCVQAVCTQHTTGEKFATRAGRRFCNHACSKAVSWTFSVDAEHASVKESIHPCSADTNAGAQHLASVTQSQTHLHHAALLVEGDEERAARNELTSTVLVR